MAGTRDEQATDAAHHQKDGVAEIDFAQFQRTAMQDRERIFYGAGVPFARFVGRIDIAAPRADKSMSAKPTGAHLIGTAKELRAILRQIVGLSMLID